MLQWGGAVILNFSLLSDSRLCWGDAYYYLASCISFVASKGLVLRQQLTSNWTEIKLEAYIQQQTRVWIIAVASYFWFHWGCHWWCKRIKEVTVTRDKHNQAWKEIRHFWLQNNLANHTLWPFYLSYCIILSHKKKKITFFYSEHSDSSVRGFSGFYPHIKEMGKTKKGQAVVDTTYSVIINHTTHTGVLRQQDWLQLSLIYNFDTVCCLI